MNGNGKAGMIQLLIQGGAVSIALIAVFFLFKLSSNHIQHNTEASLKEAEATIVLSESIKSLVDESKEQTNVMREIGEYIKYNGKK